MAKQPKKQAKKTSKSSNSPKKDTAKTKGKSPGFQILADGLKIRVEGETQRFWSSDLWIKAMRHFIVEADIHGWEKSVGEELGAPQEYWDTLLRSIALSWKIEEQSEALEGERTVGECLKHMMRMLESDPVMQEKIIPPPPEYLEEFFDSHQDKPIEDE